MPAILELEGPPGVDIVAEKDTTTTVPTSKPVVGIIYPPPEVRNIVDKTASFVARNGPEFEARIRENEINNPKFNFLNSGDPYHAYYQHKVREFQDGKAQEPNLQPSMPIIPKTVTPAAQQKQLEILKQVELQPFIPKDPPPESEFVADPPSISALDLDIVKLTAQFVARNGRQFLTNLMNREQRNYQFDFLRPQHSLFLYFTKLLEQYTKVLIPPKDLMKKLRDESSSMNMVLDQVKYRAEWIKHQEAQRRREEEEAEKERVAYAQIDWHDFVVVETVDYQPFEPGSFPPPTTPDEVGARVLMQERIQEDGDDSEMQTDREKDDEKKKKEKETAVESESESESEDDDEKTEEGEGHRPGEGERERQAGDNIQVQDMEEDSSDEEESSTSQKDHASGKGPPSRDAPLQPPPLPPTPDKVIVKRGYDPKQATKVQRAPAPDEYLISPITGGKIQASKIQEHMRIGLLDPRWVEQRDRQIHEKINQESVYAAGSAIEASLKQLAERRTDIFGVGDEETAIGKKIGEEDLRKEEKVTWDGHTSSVEAATRAARANITLEEQIHQIHKVKGLLPDEEKEKIGPKPVTQAGGMSGGPISKPLPTSSAMANKPALIPTPPKPVIAPPQPPKPPPPPMAVPAPPRPPPVGPGPIPMPPLPPAGLVPHHGHPQPPGMMMVPAMGPPLRPPPMMVPHRPGFPVPGPPVGGFLAPAPPQPQPPVPQPPPPPMQMKHMELPDDEPPSKKMRTEESLIPEALFLAKHKVPVSFKVLLPQVSDKPDWRLRGQIMNLTLPLSDSVSVIKAKIHDETSVPPGKQKLQCEGLFFKDSNSLAYYNILPGTLIQLQLKERGGRKK